MTSHVRCYQSSLKFNNFFDPSHQIQNKVQNYLIQNLIKYPLFIKVHIAT
jgi:hypothetical protein